MIVLDAFFFVKIKRGNLDKRGQDVLIPHMMGKRRNCDAIL